MTTEPFRREQCRVAAAMAAALLTALALLGFAFARAGASVPFADRLQATLRADLFVLLCLAAAIGDVARRRFFSVQDIAAAGPASPAVAAARSMLQNTLEQSVLAIGAHLTLTAAFDRSAAPVAVLVCETVPDDWHARFSCLGRAYEYRIANRRAPLTVEKGLAWQVPQPLNAKAMHEAAQLLVGRHDFTTFRSAHCQSASPVKTLSRLDVARDGDRVVVRAAARSFLHHQVRSMVGCLAMVGMERWTCDDLAEALAAADRQRLGLNAPPDGLFFVEAVY